MYKLTKQQSEALNYNKHISLTANAGSGKTFVLARRFLSILLEEKIELENIVAITFTEKAASELYKKIAAEIENRMQITESFSDYRKLENLRRSLVSAKISTIHSFCIEILKEFPAEAGIDANFLPLDKRIAEELITAAIEEIIQNSIRTNNELFEYIKKTVRLLGSQKVLHSVLKTMIYKRDSVLRMLKAHYLQGENETAKWFNDNFKEYFKLIFSGKISSFCIAIKTLNNRVGSDNSVVLEVTSLLSLLNKTDNVFGKILIIKKIFGIILTQKGTIRERGYLSKNKREGIHETVGFLENLYSTFKLIDFSEDYEFAEKELAKFGYNLLQLWYPVLENYETKKKQRGGLDFEDLLLYTKDLVQRDDVKLYLSERYKYFMIDEYQDTNETQYDIFIPILDYLKRGNLFIVGDEKQSIYMFRGADLKVFDKTKKVIARAGESGQLLELPHSFRLSKELVLFTNTLFGKLFANPKPVFNEVQYNNLIYAEKKGESESKIEFLISDSNNEDSDNEYKLVAKKILQLVNTGQYNFKDIAILSRMRKAFVPLEKELRKHEIPYQIYGGKGFYQRQEVYDVYNYLNFLLNPKSDESLVAVLRSPFFMLPDKTIFKISDCNGNSFYDKLVNYSKTNDSAKEIVSKLKTALQKVKSMQLPILIRELLYSSGYWAKVTSLKENKQIFANLDKLINTAISFADKNSSTLYDFVSYLKDAINKTEDESLAVISEDDLNVKLLTIHAAKGLEFPVVFIINTNSKGLDDRVKSKSVVIDKDFGILTKTFDNEFFDAKVTAPIVGIYNLVMQKKSEAELKRLLYVAVTRAEQSLFISATIKKGSKPVNASFLSLLTEGLDIKEMDGEKTITGNIKIMKETDDNFVEHEKQLSISIPFIFNIETGNENFSDKTVSTTENKVEINISDIKDFEQNEIISASKISVYNQCPFKYYLVYDLGFTPLFYKGKTELLVDNYEQEDSENAPILLANVKGNIIHKILEEEIPIKDMEKRIEELLVLNSLTDKSGLDKVKLSILKLIRNYMSSGTYNKIKRYTNYENEFEIYLKHNDFYLYGIIDKLIIEKNEAIIIDYKTDSLDKYSVPEKLENYKYQLLFYAYLINKIKQEINKITCRLVFIESPEEEAGFEVTGQMLENFEKKLLLAIEAMRKEEYNKNKSHCKSCYFSDSKNRCIVK
jgi:ATP-dependent helicase/nuclease subunit A